MRERKSIERVKESEISIIIPTYNRVESLKKVISSYFSQKEVKEILIINDGSTDNTEEFVNSLKRKYSKIRYIKHQQNRGSPAARNTGVKHSTRSYILFGEDDVILAENYTSQLFKCLEKTGADIIGGRGIFPNLNESFKEAIARADKFEGDLIDKRFLKGNYLKKVSCDVPIVFLHACSFIKREVFSKVFYDEGYKGNAYREESDFYIEAGKKGYKVYFCPHTLFFHLPHEVMKGGQRNRGVLNYRYWVLKNTHRFLKKHYPYLKEKLELKDSIGKLMLFQFFYEFGKIFTYFLRECSPSLYHLLTRNRCFL